MDQLSKAQAEALGYTPARVLPDGRCIGVMDMVHTCDLFVSMDERGMTTRYMYHTRGEAELALKSWDGLGDPPGNWIRQKPAGWREDKMEGIPIAPDSKFNQHLNEMIEGLKSQ